MTLFFDENASFSFQFFQLGDLSIFFKICEFFKANKCPWVGLGSRSKADLEKFLWNTCRLPFIGHSDKPICFFLKKSKKSRKVQSYFLLLSFRFVFMRSQTFELSEKERFFSNKFFQKGQGHQHSFLKFSNLIFHILLYKSTYFRKILFPPGLSK